MNIMDEVVPEHEGDYLMCEELAKGFMEDGRWDNSKLEDILKASVVERIYGEALRSGEVF